MKSNIQHIKKMSSKLSMIAALLIAMTISACDEMKVGQNPTDSVPPSAVTNVVVEPTPGGATISYDLPNETDISYVICEYTFADETKIARSSIYNNNVSIVGLGKIAPCQFTLYLVDHSENRSEPYSGSFTPLEPPYQSVFKTITIEPDFGGVVIRWHNETKAIIGAFLYAMDDDGEWVEADLVFSSVAEEKRSIRGYNTDLRKFGVKLTDQFGNMTDTIVSAESPLFEKELDKKKFVDGHLYSDNNSPYTNGRVIENIWDGKLDVMWHSDPNKPVTPPQMFTINLGVQAQLSRMMLWNRQDGFVFNQHNVHLFEVWGYPEAELPYRYDNAYWGTPAWKDGWVFLGDFEQIKPSGLPLGQTNADDEAASAAGSEFVFESGAGNIQYLRFVIKETWGRTSALHIAELSIFGNDAAEDESEGDVENEDEDETNS